MYSPVQRSVVAMEKLCEEGAVNYVVKPAEHWRGEPYPSSEGVYNRNVFYESVCQITIRQMADAGKWLIPTNSANARMLLKQGKAKVIQRTPFAVQLVYETTEYIQPVTVGIDD